MPLFSAHLSDKRSCAVLEKFPRFMSQPTFPPWFQYLLRNDGFLTNFWQSHQDSRPGRSQQKRWRQTAQRAPWRHRWVAGCADCTDHPGKGEIKNSQMLQEYSPTFGLDLWYMEVNVEYMEHLALLCLLSCRCKSRILFSSEKMSR